MSGSSRGGRGTGKSIIQRPYSYAPSAQASQSTPAIQPHPPQHIQNGVQVTPSGSRPPQQFHLNGSQWQNHAPSQTILPAPQFPPYGHQEVPTTYLPTMSPAIPVVTSMRHALPARPQMTMNSGPVAGPSMPTQFPVASYSHMQASQPYSPRPTHVNAAPDNFRRGSYSESSQRYAPSGSGSRGIWCDSCQASAGRTDFDLARHKQEHVHCCKKDEGCTFSAWPQIVEIHEQDRHLIFRPGARRERTSRDGPPDAKIQGTNVSLETEEDIAKWIAERKRKWPGKKNDELRQQRDLKRREYEAASPAILGLQRNQAKRGRYMQNISSSGRERLETQNARYLASQQDQSRPVTGQIAQGEGQATHSLSTKHSGESDDEDSQVDADVAAQLLRRVKASSPLPGRPGNVAEETEEMLDVQQATTDAVQIPLAVQDADKNDIHDESDDSGPEEEATLRRVSQSPDADDNLAEVEEVPDKAIVSNRSVPAEYAPMQRECRSWATTGTCKFGQRCRFTHDPKKRVKQRMEAPSAPKNPFERGDLIGKLVHHEVKREVSDLAQVIDFLARNSWLENVELYPGHKKELDDRITEVK